MTHNNIQHHFILKNDLYLDIQFKIENILSEAIKQKGQAFMAVSGGNTPKKLFENLSHSDLDWSRVYITLVDERWVDSDNSDSNEYLVRNFLMKNKAAKANFIALKNEKESPYEGVKICQEQFQDFEEEFDLVILGMGEDGHTASFFPQAKELEKALTCKDCCVAITPPKAPYERMTLSLSRLLRASKIFLHVEGKKKLEVLHDAFQYGSIKELPIRAFIHREKKPYLEVFYAK